MKKISFAFLSLTVGFFLFSCASVPVAPSHSVITPEMFEQNGVVVGQLTSISVDRRLGHSGEIIVGQMSNSSPEIFGKPSFTEKFPRVNSLADENGYIDFAYPEGQYTINEFLFINGANTTRYPINLSFVAKNHTIRNIGHILILFDPKNSSGYRVFVVDNEKKMEDYLAANYPEQYTSLEKDFTVKPLGGTKKITADEALALIEKIYGKTDPKITERF